MSNLRTKAQNSSLMYAELRSHFHSKFIVFTCLYRSPSRTRISSLWRRSRTFFKFTPSCGLASVLSSSSLRACGGRSDHFPEHVFRVWGRSPRRSSVRQPCKPFEGFCQPSLWPFKGFYCGDLHVGASLPPLSVVMLRSSHPPHEASRTNAVLRPGA